MPQLSAFMAQAPSMPAGGHRMRDFFSNQHPPRSLPYTAPTVTPYLGLRARLSQIWINRWTILLLLVLVRTLIAIASVNDGIGSSRREALSACSSVESMGSAMASMPHYMSKGVNELTASGVEKAVNGLMQMTTLAVTAVEEIAIFVINMMTSTYLCLITFAVTGSLRAVIDIMDAAQKQLNDMTKNLGDDMVNVLSTFNDAYNKVRDTLKGGVLGIGGGVTLPSLDVNDDIQKLRNLTLPAGLASDLQKLNSSIPTFKEVQDAADNLIRIPFEEIKDLINKSMGTYTFDRSAFPVPQKETLSFCGQDTGIDGFFDHLLEIASKAKTIFLGILIAAAILACIPMGYREIRRYRTMKAHSQLIGNAERDPMDVVYIVSRPYTATAGIKASSSAATERRQALIRWVVAYATTDAALFVLSLAAAGLFSCLCQFILFKSLEKEVPGLSERVGNFTEQIVVKLNDASQKWAVGTNEVITKTNNTINEDLFGWVETGTTAVNNTLNQFVNITSLVLDKTFGNGPLRDPVQEVLNCLVLLKVAGLQKGLTWVHDHAHIDIPLMSADTFSLGAVESLASDAPPDQSFLADPGDKAADKISSVITRFLNKMYDGIRTEAIISAVVLSLWFVILLVAVIRALTLWFRSERVHGDGGAAPVTTHAPTTPVHYNISAPMDFRSDNQDRFRAFDDVPLDNIKTDDRRMDEHHQADPGLPTYHTVVSAGRNVSGNANPFTDRYQQDRVLERNMNPPFAEMRDAPARSIRSQRGSVWDGDSKI